jgi:4a-hydroxytetrahydrobiopterin dehydratase
VIDAPDALGTRRPPGPPGWRRAGASLVRELAFRDFEEAMSFVEELAQAAADHLRRPDVCILDFNRVRLTIASRGGPQITLAELRLAAKVNAIVDSPRPLAVSSHRAGVTP